MRRLLVALAVVFVLAAAACSGGDEGGASRTTASASASPTQAPGTPRPPDTEEAKTVFADFVEAVLADDLEAAWGMYAASVEGTKDEHNAKYGCDYDAFAFEFPRMRNLFSRIAPLEVIETYGAAPGSLMIELRLRAPDGNTFLGTVVRVRPDEGYRLRFFNSGEVSRVPGAPDPQPSPDDPTGICGIWTGPR